MATVVFEINGQTAIVNDVDPHCTLLQWLRASGRTGSKEGCAEGECGACAVAWVSRDERGRLTYEAVNSCLVPLSEVHGRQVLSVEAVQGPGGELHPVQQALVETGGSQCGYCTPGFVMSLFCEYYRPGRSGYDPESISGNLCRCTGYRPIVDAARLLGAPASDDVWQERLGMARGGVPASDEVGPGLRFQRPDALSQLLELLAEHPESMLVAGGTDLMVSGRPESNAEARWLSLGALDELKGFYLGERELVIGAGLSLSLLERHLAQADLEREARLLGEVLPLFSSRLIRNRATLGGNLATASPIGDAAPVLLALGAELALVSRRGQRRLPLREFFVGYRKTALAPGELILRVHVPRPMPSIQRFYKVSKRALDDISTVSAAFALDLTSDGRIERLRIAYGGIAATPVRADSLEALAEGRPWSAETLRSLIGAARQLGTPLSDHRGSAAYRQAMVEKLLERFYWETSSLREAAQ